MATYKCPNGHGTFTPRDPASYKPMTCLKCGAVYVEVKA